MIATLRQNGRRPGAVIVVVLVLVLVGGSILAFYRWQTNHQAAKIAREIQRTLAEPIYPAAAIVCKGTVTPVCAGEAAKRAKHAVAWLGGTVSLQSSDVVVVRTLAFQELRGDGLLVTVSSPPQVKPSGRVVRTLTENGVLLTVRQLDENPGATLQVDWTIRGRLFEISALAIPKSAISERELLDWWKQVQYAQP